ncbi:MAG: error-prone DNA polymerase [Rhodospirillales bacterium]|nr:error-prone DNA polymerase [Rhodospirillales bacterium]
MSYAELQVTSNFTFLTGASHPQELVETALALGLAALALTDRNSLAGVVRAHVAAKAAGLRFIVGCRLDLADGPSLLCWPTDRAAYGRLCRLLTLGKRRAPKGDCTFGWEDLGAHVEGQICAALPPDQLDTAFAARLKALNALAPGRAYLALHYRHDGGDMRRLNDLAALARTVGMPTLATNDVYYHTPARRPLQDVLTCIREGCRIDEAGLRLAANAERYLKPPAEMRRLFRGHEDAVARTLLVVEHCRFSLDELRYEYPEEPIPPGRTPQTYLEDLTWQGAAERWPDGLPPKIEADLKRELALIGKLGYAAYFLTVHDIVREARCRGILCQGRGSAANSAVCFCLGITGVNPAEMDLLFERFVSEERNEPPDIDVDFEHERREEVIQYIYERYGRDRAGIAAAVISYRPRSAVRDVGKAMGLSEDVTARLAATVWGSWGDGLTFEQVTEAGFDPADLRLCQTLALTGELIGFPRHLSQHVGGFVLTRGRLDETVPIGNAAMADRTFIEWDKDDIDALGILKVDILALGMLTCIRKAFALIGEHHRRTLSLANVPREDVAVYDMLCRADSIGVFQVESRAQMNMLPRLRPRTFYDLVIEVAIVRPGPIQGDMVHPYLRRRQGLEPVSYPSEDLRQVLGKTLGVPLFQEQAMKIAIVAAGFTPAESDRLRRAMATFRHSGTIHGFREKFIPGMIARGYQAVFAERCFQQIEGFADYGFPESHSASFAHLVYVSAWLKCHYPAAFAAALLNSQPMGFYAPAQIVGDARAHGVAIRPVDVNHSAWDCTLEPAAADGVALRLGFRLVDGLGEETASRLVAVRGGGYRSVGALHRRAAMPMAAIERLAAAGAFRSLGLDRRAALWQALAIADGSPLPLFDTMEDSAAESGPTVALPVPTPAEQMLDDYRSLGLSLEAHPMAFLRSRFAAERVVTVEAVRATRDRARLAVAGVVLVRQRPGSAKGVVFITLEDETGIVNLVVWPAVLKQFRKVVMTSRLLLARGMIQRSPEGIVHLVADQLVDRTGDLDHLGPRPPALPLARADEVARPGRDGYIAPRHPRDTRVIPKSRDFR